MTDSPTTLQTIANALHHLRTTAYEHPLNPPPPKDTPHPHTTGPRPPTTLTTLTTVIDADQRLQELALNAAQDAHTPLPQTPTPWTGEIWCAWFHRHHTALQHLDWYDDLTTELTDLADELSTIINPPTDTPHIEQRQTARTITYRLQRMGHTINQATLRQWAARGKVTAHKDTNGKLRYLMSEVLNQL